MVLLRVCLIGITVGFSLGASAQEIIKRDNPAFHQVAQTLNGQGNSEVVKKYFQTTAQNALALVKENDFTSACQVTTSFIDQLPVVASQKFKTPGAVFVRKYADAYALACLKAIRLMDKSSPKSKIDQASDFYLKLTDLISPLEIRLGSVPSQGGNRDNEYYGFFIDRDVPTVIVGMYDGDADEFSVVNNVQELQAVADGANVLSGTLNVFGAPAREKAVRAISGASHAYKACDKVYSDFNKSNACKGKAEALSSACVFHASKDNYSEGEHFLCIENEAKKLKL